MQQAWTLALSALALSVLPLGCGDAGGPAPAAASAGPAATAAEAVSPSPSAPAAAPAAPASAPADPDCPNGGQSWGRGAGCWETDPCGYLPWVTGQAADYAPRCGTFQATNDFPTAGADPSGPCGEATVDCGGCAPGYGVCVSAYSVTSTAIGSAGEVSPPASPSETWCVEPCGSSHGPVQGRSPSPHSLPYAFTIDCP